MATRVDGKFERSARVTPANGITLVRLLATPVILVLVISRGPSWGAFVAWVALSSTDFVDGWVARRQGVTTSGAFLDPLADKVLVIGALVALAADGLIGWVPIVLITAREVAISVYRSVVARRGVSVPARPLAKIKTASQDLAVSLILLPVVGVHHVWVGRDLLWVAVVLALVSGGQYLVDGRRPSPGSSTVRVGDHEAGHPSGASTGPGVGAGSGVGGSVGGGRVAASAVLPPGGAAVAGRTPPTGTPTGA